jgi:hypothetical protein
VKSISEANLDKVGENKKKLMIIIQCTHILIQYFLARTSSSLSRVAIFNGGIGVPSVGFRTTFLFWTGDLHVPSCTTFPMPNFHWSTPHSFSGDIRVKDTTHYGATAGVLG